MSMGIPYDLDFSQKVESIGVGEKKTTIAEPINGRTFTVYSGMSPEIPIYGGKEGLFCDCTNMILECKIKNTNATAANSLTLEPKTGTAGLVQNLYVRTQSGETITSNKKFNVLYPMKTQQIMDSQWYSSTGAILYGHADADVANAPNTIAGGGTNTIVRCIPLCLSSFFQQKYFSLAGETIYITLDLESALISMIGVENDATDIQISEIKLYYDVHTMKPEAWRALKAEYNGVLKYYGKEYIHFPDTMAANSTELLTTLGWKKKRLTKIIACVRSTTQVATQTTTSLSNRHQASITEFGLYHDGQIVNQREVTFSVGGSRAYAELLKSSGGVWKVHSPNIARSDFLLEAPTGSAVNEVGNFFMEIDLESLFQDNQLSGLEVYNSLQFHILKTAVNTAYTVDIFGEFWQEISQDFNQAGLTKVDSNKLFENPQMA